MSLAYRHGVYIFEQPTAILPPVRVDAALPVVVGTAPIHKAQAAAGVNETRLIFTAAEAASAFGYERDDDFAAYTLSEFFDAYFALFGVCPVVAINVYDPAVHKSSQAPAAKTFDARGEIALSHEGLLAGTVVVTNEAGDTTYVQNTDYTVDLPTGLLARKAGGAIAAGATVKVSYDYGDPSKVTKDDVIGGVDALTGKATGLDLVNEVFPKFRLVPGQIHAPKFSTDPEVAALMHAKAGNINSHFKAIAVVDVPSEGADKVTLYTNVPQFKEDNNLVDPQLVVCWPKVKLGDRVYHLSTQLAGIMGQADAENESIPYRSPSNLNLQAVAAVADGQEVWLGPDQTNYLNSQGIVTAQNFIGGWRSWGNRTGCYPANTDPKDSFIAIRRMFNWIGNTLVLTFWQRVDFPITRRLVETVVDSANIWLNGLAARQFILGGRVEFRRDENPTTDLMDGIIRFHVYVTPPSPARELDFIMEYDPAYLETLFG